jgi:murein DD-endopeptidase MepM/ murein hydrolase activator NlpD
MPMLGKSSRKLYPGRLALAGLVAVAAGLTAAILMRRHPHPAPLAAAAPPPLASAPAPHEPPPSPKPPTAEEILKKAGLRHVSVSVDGPLETMLVKQVGKELGRPLTQVVVRALVWWLEVPGDLRRGDTLDVLFEEREGEEPLIEALCFKSEKLGKTLRAYRWKPEHGRFGRFYDPSGQELEERLADGPIDDYEQITSLLRDGRGHKGIDFKTPLGTPVKAPFDGVVERKNWNFRGNGNSIEIRESGGQHRTALFLHLSPLPASLHVCERVSRGQVIAQSGNTGHSFAPHLHYQLMSASGQVIDPFASHATHRRSLPADQKAGFEAEERRLDGLMNLVVAGNDKP